MVASESFTDERDISSEAYERLTRHLRNWLGEWPVEGEVVVYSPYRERPGWDGQVRSLLGVATPDSMVLSVAKQYVQPLEAALSAGGVPALEGELSDIFGLPGLRLGRGVFRYHQRLVAHESVGQWKAPNDPSIPEWLRPFNREVLVAIDEGGNYTAGVGRKGHDEFGEELSIVTEPTHRGRGYAHNLVAQAACRVFDEGLITTYLHSPDNVASAAVANSAGFPDQGWTAIRLAGTVDRR